MSKVCIKCEITSSEETFARRGSGYRNTCKTCHNLSKVAWSKANAETRAETIHRHYARKVGKNPEECRRIPLSDGERRQKKRDAAKRDYLQNKQRYLERASRRAREKMAEVVDYRRKWLSLNREKKRSQDAAWRAAHPDKVNVYSNARRARKLRAQPAWLSDNDLKKIEAVYEEAARRRVETGVVYHVDHIVPLKGKSVCGLHVPWNLQVLTKTENLRKGARLSETFVEDRA